MKDIMSIKELSEYLGIGKSKIYDLIKHGKIPASKIGRQYKFSKDVVDQWLKEKIVTKKENTEKTLFDGTTQIKKEEQKKIENTVKNEEMKIEGDNTIK